MHLNAPTHRFCALTEGLVPRGLAVVLRLLHAAQLGAAYVALQRQRLRHCTRLCTLPSSRAPSSPAIESRTVAIGQARQINLFLYIKPMVGEEVMKQDQLKGRSLLGNQLSVPVPC